MRLLLNKGENLTSKVSTTALSELDVLRSGIKYNFHGVIDEGDIFSRTLPIEEIQGVMKGELIAPGSPQDKLAC